MLHTTTEYRNAINENNRKFYVSAEITLADGTVLYVDNSKIVTLKIEDAVSQQGEFTVGSAIINELTLVLNNIYDEFSIYDFTNAVIVPSIGLQLSDSIETLSKGIFIAEDPKAVDTVITISAFDHMVKFDKPFSEVEVAFPTTAYILLDAVCTHCGVVLSTNNFINDDFEIQARPDDSATSCREIVSWIAQIAGCFARCNVYGELELKWYDVESFDNIADGGIFDSTESTSYQSGDNLDGGNLTDYTSGDSFDGGLFSHMDKYHSIYMLSSLSVATDDVVITGIKVSDNADTLHTAMFGIDGYVLSLEGNELIQSESDAQIIADSIGAKIVGMRFRPMSCNAWSDPSREAGDIAYITDRKQNVYQTLLTNVTFEVYKNDNLICDAEPPLRNSSTRYSIETKTVLAAKKAVDTKITSYDLAVQRMNSLAAHTLGYYFTEEKLTDGSTVTYRHDKPLLSDSTIIFKEGIDGFFISTDGGETYNNGFDSQGNAVLNILDAVGIRAEWIKAGKLYSPSGKVMIDMDYGVANSDNISASDNIQNGYPLTMKIYLDNSVTKISQVYLNFDQQPFRTYSTTTSSGGSVATTSGASGDGMIATEMIHLTNTTLPGGAISKSTGTASGTGSHSHSMSVADHQHSIDLGWHGHPLHLSSHTHSVYLDAHSHSLNYGIQEYAISDYSISIFVDGTQRATASDVQGIIDLTAYITTAGWHTVEIQSATLKRVSARLVVKSYIAV